MDWIELARDLGIFGIAAYVIKVIINKSITKQIEQYRSQLEMAFFKYSKYHEKRLEVISRVYADLTDLHFAMQQLTAVIKIIKEDYESEEKKRIQNTISAYENFRVFYSRNKIFINHETCVRIDEIKTRYYNMLCDYSIIQNHNFSEIALKLQKDIQNDISITIPDILKKLDSEFRGEICIEEPKKEDMK